MKINNLANVSELLNKELVENSDITKPLEVVSSHSDNNSVVVASSRDTDVLIRLRGLSLKVGTVITVDITTGNVSITSEPTSPAKTTAKPATQGCSDYSQIRR